MPPAFNLSQDQTLQFNSCFFASVPSSTETSLALKWNRKFPSLLPSSFQCETLLCSSPSDSHLRSSHTDRFVAKFLKNFVFCLPLGATRFGILHNSKPFCKSEFPFPLLFFLAPDCSTFRRALGTRGRIISAFSALSKLIFTESHSVLPSNNSSNSFSLKQMKN